MRIALLGNGKTGGKIAELASVTVFNSKNVPTFDKLKDFDVIISFLPGEAFKSYIPLLLKTKIPVVTGSTGFTPPANLDADLKDKNISWVYASNFSLGVVVAKQLIQKLSSLKNLFNDPLVTIHEIHHSQKQDAPSGTALSMKEWYGECEISSERIGDVIGFHELTLSTGPEIIKISHEARDRKMFAQGALWAANDILRNPVPGLNTFHSLIERGIR